MYIYIYIYLFIYCYYYHITPYQECIDPLRWCHLSSIPQGVAAALPPSPCNTTRRAARCSCSCRCCSCRCCSCRRSSGRRCTWHPPCHQRWSRSCLGSSLDNWLVVWDNPSIIYGLSSFPLTNSIIFQWGWNHQADFEVIIIWCFKYGK